jgi:hypothetical protein
MAEKIADNVLPLLSVEATDTISKEIVVAAVKNPKRIEIFDPIDSPEFMNQFEGATHIVIRECHLKTMLSLVHLKHVKSIELYYKKNVMVNLWGLGFIKGLDSVVLGCERIPMEAVEDFMTAAPKQIALRATNATQIKGELKKACIMNKLPILSVHAEDIKKN